MPIPLKSAIDSFLQTLQAQAYSARTVKGYREDLKQFAMFAGENIEVITAEQVNAYLCGHKEKAKRASPNYYNRRLSCLRSFFRYLVETEQLPEENDPTRKIKFARLSRTNPSFLTYDEYLTLLETVRRTATGVFRYRDYAILVTLYNAGIRVSELVSLDCAQFKPEEAVFLSLKRKGGVIRDLPLNQNVIHAVNRWIQARREWDCGETDALFITCQGKRASVRTVQRMVLSVAQLAKLGKPVTPHTFRHSHCTEIQLRGASIAVAQQLLDHRDIATTSRYSHSNDKAMRAALSSLDDPATWEP